MKKYLGNSQVPDWKNKSDYDYINRLNFDVKAWEFLRRNNKYRREWDKYNSREINKKSRQSSEKLATKWHLEQLIDYRDDNPRLCWNFKSKAPTITDTDSKYLQRKPQYIAIGFDLTLKISAQINLAKLKMERLRKHLEKEGLITLYNTSNSFKGNLVYLRLLDAKLEKTTLDKIIKHFMKESEETNYDRVLERVRKQLKTARKIRNEDYIKLLAKY